MPLFSPLGQVWNSTPGGFTWANAKWVAGDFNGDGKADLMAFYDLGSPEPYNVGAIGAYEWQSAGSGLTPLGQIWNTLGNGGFTWANAAFLS